MKLLYSLSFLFVIACSLAAHADNVQWLDPSGQFRLLMLDQKNTAYPVLLYGRNQRIGPNCPQPGSCAFVLRGRIESTQTLVFEPLQLNAIGSKAAGLEGHQSELPAQFIAASETVWSFYSTDTNQARLTCISPKTSCGYFESGIVLNQEKARVIQP